MKKFLTTLCFRSYGFFKKMLLAFGIVFFLESQGCNPVQVLLSTPVLYSDSTEIVSGLQTGSDPPFLKKTSSLMSYGEPRSF